MLTDRVLSALALVLAVIGVLCTVAATFGPVVAAMLGVA